MDRVQYLAGQISAMETILRALIRTHPNKTDLAREFIGSIDGQQAMTLPAPVPEEFLQGQRDQYSTFATLIQAATAS